jgi:hypothetical protein
MSAILCLFQYAAIKLKPAQLAIEKQVSLVTKDAGQDHSCRGHS